MDPARRTAHSVVVGFLLASLLALAGCSDRPGHIPDPDKALDHYVSPCEVQVDRHFVFDYTGIMAEVDENGDRYGAVVEQFGCDLFLLDGVHLVLVLVPDLGGQDIVSYSVDLVRAWGIGDAKREDGLLLLYTLDDGTGQTAARFEVGYGLESPVTASVVANLLAEMQQVKQDALASGDTPQGSTARALAYGAIELARFTSENHDGPPGTAAKNEGFRIPLWVYLVGGIVLIALFVPPPMRRLTTSFLAILLLRGGGRGGGGFGGGKSGGGGWNGRL